MHETSMKDPDFEDAPPVRSASSAWRRVELCVVETGDVHGCFFSQTVLSSAGGGLDKVSSYLKDMRRQYGSNLLLFDNGDMLQGQPINYFSNHVCPQEENIAARVVNALNYDAQAVGNHDIETGHDVYEKWAHEVNCPLLGANIIDSASGSPYFEPFAVFDRQGVRVAVVGMTTTAIPYWLDHELWQGLKFLDIKQTAQQWVQRLKNEVKADLIIALLHTGWEGGIRTSECQENVALQIAREVDGFDLILCGHDHALRCQRVTNPTGKTVFCLNPSSDACYVGEARISLTLHQGKVVQKDINARLVDITVFSPDTDFIDSHRPTILQTEAFTQRKIGTLETTLYIRDAYFGSSALIDSVHNVQLKLTGADISFNAPLAFNTVFLKGDILVRDLFKLYKYENLLDVIEMTGDEVRNYLEMSYSLWIVTMQSPDDPIMCMRPAKGSHSRYMFSHLAFNFDTAAGINYEVDVTRPDGQKVNILSLANGMPFESRKTYRVALNSYRASGGGQLLTLGAGIPHSQLSERIVSRSKVGLRELIQSVIEQAGTLRPQPNNNWHFVPRSWTQPAIERDKQLLFPSS